MPLLHLSPLLLVLLALMVLRRPPLQAALAGCSLALLLWACGAAQPMQAPALAAAALDTAVLLAITASVIVPGLVFVILIEGLGINQVLSQSLQSLALPRPHQVLLVVLGLGPMLESLTGFGVSMVATIPLLLALFERQVALRLAILGMGIMPWGTLGLATVVGAPLAGLPAERLATDTVFTSAPVFLAIATLSLWWTKARDARAWLALALCCLLFLAVLAALSRFTGPEMAGVGAGLAVMVVLLAPSWAQRPGSGGAGLRAAMPYLVLIGCVLLLKGGVLLTQADGLWQVAGHAVVWKPLTSPGLALAAASMGIAWRHPGLLRPPAGRPALGQALRARATRPLLTIAGFLALSQIMVKGGFLDALTQALSALSLAAAGPVVAALGALSGYLTGSTLGGNAIFMPAIGLLPETARPLLAALQNSGAGHAAMGSIPIAMVALGLARGTREEEGALVRFGFLLACLNTLLVALAGLAALAL